MDIFKEEERWRGECFPGLKKGDYCTHKIVKSVFFIRLFLRKSS